MTNKVYEVRWPDGPDGRRGCPRRVLLRIYGESAEVLFCRDDEIAVFEKVSLTGQGPRLLARFPQGRVEEWLNATTLAAADLRSPVIQKDVARKLWEFHQLDVALPRIPIVWRRLRKWRTSALELCDPADIHEFNVYQLQAEIAQLQSVLHCGGSRKRHWLGFCHNDLQYGNIMRDATTGILTLIDYEYAGYNPVAYDIANHFCEMAADYHTPTPHILDYSKYPGLIERRQFVQSYMAAAGHGFSYLGSCVTKSSADGIFESSDVEAMLEEVEKFTLASHLTWALWGLISATLTDIDFDFRAYAQNRLQEYRKRKALLFLPA
eukprot:SM000183S03998  [mRNA]  locus=s183:163671:165937:- [translate_table: standard]